MKAPDRPTALPASRAVDPDFVARTDRRSRHRPLCLCAGAAGHARFAGVVLFRRRLHEHHQRRRLSGRRAVRLATDPAFWAGRRGALGNAGLRAVAGAVRDLRQFFRAEFCAVAGRVRRSRLLRRRRRTGGDDCAIAARTRQLSAQPVLRRARHRHPRLRTDRALRAAGVRPRLVVDRVVGVDAAGGGHDHSAVAGAIGRRRRRQRARRRPNSRSRRSCSISRAIFCSARATSPT